MKQGTLNLTDNIHQLAGDRVNDVVTGEDGTVDWYKIIENVRHKVGDEIIQIYQPLHQQIREDVIGGIKK